MATSRYAGSRDFRNVHGSLVALKLLKNSFKANKPSRSKNFLKKSTKRRELVQEAQLSQRRGGWLRGTADEQNDYNRQRGY